MTESAGINCAGMALVASERKTRTLSNLRVRHPGTFERDGGLGGFVLILGGGIEKKPAGMRFDFAQDKPTLPGEAVAAYQG
jgi:hypothetical protein